MKVLFIPGFSKETDSANITCTNEVIHALQKMPGYEIHIAGETLKRQSASVNWRKNLFFMIRKILFWPVIDPDASEECYKEIIWELKHADYDAVIVSHMPYDAVLAAVRAKRKYPNIHLMLYELDPITYEIDKERKSLGKYLYFLRVLAEKRTYDRCDTIFHMECNRKKFSENKYKKYRNKSVYLDFPLVHDKNVNARTAKKYDGQILRFVYAGKLMSHFRSPEYLLKVIVKLREQINLEVSFYSSGDCEDIIHEYSKKYMFIHQKGYVDKGTLLTVIQNSDGLINIGNKISDMLPSKLLTYIETGMPILHVQNQKNDACIDYLNRYKLAVIIDENDPVDVSVDKLLHFFCKNYKRKLGSDFILSKFAANTPEYSADMIDKRIISIKDGEVGLKNAKK